MDKSGVRVVVLGQATRDSVLVTPEAPEAGGSVDMERRLKLPGGKRVNTAVAAAQPGARAALVGVVVVGQATRDLVPVVPEVPEVGSSVDVRRRLELPGGRG